MIHFDSIRILRSIKLDDAYGEDGERLPMKKLSKVFLEKAAMDIGVRKVK